MATSKNGKGSVPSTLGSTAVKDAREALRRLKNKFEAEATPLRILILEEKLKEERARE